VRAKAYGAAYWKRREEMGNVRQSLPASRSGEEYWSEIDRVHDCIETDLARPPDGEVG
jgi:hypothetical protein